MIMRKERRRCYDLFELRKAIGAIWLQLDLSVQTKSITELLPPFCRTLSSAIGSQVTGGKSADRPVYWFHSDESEEFVR